MWTKQKCNIVSPPGRWRKKRPIAVFLPSMLDWFPQRVLARSPTAISESLAGPRSHNCGPVILHLLDGDPRMSAQIAMHPVLQKRRLHLATHALASRTSDRRMASPRDIRWRHRSSLLHLHHQDPLEHVQASIHPLSSSPPVRQAQTNQDCE